jgi:hypothetical protein
MRAGILAIVAVSWAASAEAAAPNLLSNESFSAPAPEWILRAGDAAFDTDRVGTPGSNSLLLRRTGPGTGVLVQYVPILADTEYLAGGCLRIDSFDNGSATGVAQLGVNFTTEPCGGGTFLPESFGTSQYSTTADQWICASVPFVTPAAAECAEFVLFVRNDTADTFGTNFDDVYLVEAPEATAAPQLAALLLAGAAWRNRRQARPPSPRRSSR